MKIIDIKVGNRFRKDLGDIKTLVNSIQEIGLLQPIVVTQDNELIAGQRRLEAHRLLGWTDIPAHVINLDDIIKGEFHENAVRKDFSISEMVGIKRAIWPELHKEAERRQEAGIGVPSSNLDKGRTDTKVANYLGLGKDNLRKAEKIVEAAERQPEEYGGLLTSVDARRMTINEAYKRLQNQQKIHELINATPIIELPDNVKLIQGDFRVVAKEIPENSIDLILTDPPYDQEHLYLYRDLGILAARVLKEGGSLMTLTGHQAVFEAGDYVQESGLKYIHISSLVHSGASAMLYAYKIRVKWKPILWFVKGTRPTTSNLIVEDVIYSTPPDKALHEWEQSTAEADHIIKGLTVGENQIVLDPFMGAGTFGRAALKLKRKFIGIEMDPRMFEIARANLARDLD